MSSKVKDISVKNRTYYFFDDTSNIKIFDLSKALKKNSYLLHWICDVKDSKYVKINSVNPLYLIFSKINGYSEEINKNKYLALVPTNDSKEKINKYEKLWSKIRISLGQ